MNHEHYMRRCIELAEEGLGSVAPNPLVGCVIVHDSKIIGEGYHEKFGSHHAEVNAINTVKNKSVLTKSILYVTLEPCTMCGGALMWSQVSRIAYGAPDTKRGYTTVGMNILHPKTRVVSGILEKECSELLKKFFRKKRE